MPYFVYILECSDGTLYTGITNNLQKRFLAHQKGMGGAYTRSHKPLKVIYKEILPDKSNALKRELEIKRLTKSQKITLISH